jgi:uncharacterized membrane protein
MAGPAPLASLAIATFAFVGLHFLMSHPLRTSLVRALTERGFLGLYSLVSLATFVWMIIAYRAGDDMNPLWIAPPVWWLAGSALMLIASVLFVGSLRHNPAFPNPGAGPTTIGEPDGVFAITRHPMNTAFMLWAFVHASISGSPRNLIVAGGIFVLALFGSIGQDLRKQRQLGAAWRDWAAATSVVPFGALLGGRLPWRAALPGWTATIGGIALWALITSWHAPLVSPLGDLVRRFAT